MVTCPLCDYENIAGEDFCEACGQSLIALSMPKAHSRLEKSIVKDRIAVLDPREPLVCSPDATVSWVLKLMYDHSVGCAVVADEEGRPIGVFSERDALMRLGPDVGALGDRAIREFMTPEPSTLEESDRIAFALHRMDLGGYRHIPIVTDGRVSGVISVRDILRYINQRLLPLEPA